MFRAAVLAVGAVLTATVLLVIHLSTGPDPFASEPGLVLGTGFVLFSLIATGGVLLSRGRWARYLALGLIGAQLAAVVATDLSGWSVAGAFVAGLALAVVVGPWMRGWFRLRPAADGPGPQPIALLLGAVGLVPLVAIASPRELTSWHGVLAGAGIFLAYTYSRAQLWALWAFRIGIGILAIPAIVASGVVGGPAVGIYVAGLTAVAWTEAARLAADPVFNQLPGPRVGTPKGARLGDEEHP